MIPVPNLDDRTWQDLVDEAVRLIPKYCPEWTNHNPSDPGITLIELFAWLMEMTIYRLNKVTDKNFLAFLDLMGIDLQPPQPARALVSFSLNTGAKNYQVVSEGTTVATDYVGDEEPVVFETLKDVVVLPNKLAKCYTQFHDTYDDCTDRTQGRLGRSFEAFMGCRRIDRLIYICDPNFETLSDEALLVLGVTTPEAPDSEFVLLCEWEFWNGRRWVELKRSSQEMPSGYIAFEGPENFDVCEVDDIEGFWIRGRLIEVPRDEESTIVDKVFVRVEILGEGVLPDELDVQIDDGLFISPDLTRNFSPLHKDPKADHVLYLASEDLFSKPGARIRIECELADPELAEKPNPSKDLQIRWEYFDGKRWQMLGMTTPEGVEESAAGVDFDDSTLAFSEHGVVSFKIPEDVAKGEVNGKESFWVRARVMKGDYGVPGTYALEGSNWAWQDTRPLRPPTMKSLSIKYLEDDRAPQSVVTYNDFRYNDISDQIRSDLQDVQVFEAIAEESPSIYFGFDGMFPTQRIGMFIHVLEKTSADLERDNEDLLKSYYKKMEEQYYGDRKLVWEYWNGVKWYDLGVSDETRGFTESGFVNFDGPRDMGPTRRFGEFLFWIRCRLEMGGYEQLPRIDHVLLNSVYAEHRTTILNEVIGNGGGTPNETFEMINKPVLEGEEVWVREKETPPDDELEALATVFNCRRRDIIKEDASGDGYWVRWLCVDSFYASGNRDRHYRIDRINGKVSFGSGRRGMLVPKGDRNVKAQMYRVGGGARGNVGPNKVTILRQAIAYIDSVTNHYPASGGSDIESVEELKQRGPYLIKSRDRAVTQEDFEWLSMQASASIARTHCLPSNEREGEVKVLIVPKFNEDNPDYREKLVPSTELLRRVKAFLDERRLVTVKVNVERPEYREISVKLDVVRSPTGSSERLKRDLDLALRRFLHPIHGSRTGRGWDFGRNILKVDLYHVAEEVEGVDFVDRILIKDEDRQVFVEQVKLGPTQLPFVVDIEISEKARERIL